MEYHYFIDFWTSNHFHELFRICLDISSSITCQTEQNSEDDETSQFGATILVSRDPDITYDKEPIIIRISNVEVSRLWREISWDNWNHSFNKTRCTTWVKADDSLDTQSISIEIIVWHHRILGNLQFMCHTIGLSVFKLVTLLRLKIMCSTTSGRLDLCSYIHCFYDHSSISYVQRYRNLSWNRNRDQ